MSETCRVEMARPFLWGKDSGRIFVSLGYWDDYLELQFPDGLIEATEIIKDISGIFEEAIGGTLDAKVRTLEDCILLCILVLYVGHADQRERPPQDRLTSLLSEMVRALPPLRFPDLAPDAAQAACGPEGEAIALSAMATSQAVPIETLPPLGMPHDDGGAPMAVGPLAGETGTENKRQSTLVSEESVTPMLHRADLLSRAREQAQRGQVHRALRGLETILHWNQEDEEARSLRETLRLLEKREKRRQKDPRSSRANLEAGFSHLAVGSNHQAIEALQQACRLDNRVHLAHVLLGIAFHRERQTSMAEEAYRAALRICPADTVPQRLLMALRMGDDPPPLLEAVNSSPRLRVSSR